MQFYIIGDIHLFRRKLQDQGDRKLCEVMNIESQGSEGHISMSVTHSVE